MSLSKRERRALTGALTVLVACAGCSASSGASTSHSPSRPPQSPHTAGKTPPTATALAPRYVTLGGKRVRVPSEYGNYPISPTSDHGQQVIISPKGFVPETLYANSYAPIVWTNLTSSTEELTLDNGQVHSGPIPPGGSYRWFERRLIAFRYQGSSGMTGYLYVNVIP